MNELTCLGVQAIVKQALEHSPAYGTIKDVLDNLKADEVGLFVSIVKVGNFFFEEICGRTEGFSQSCSGKYS